MNVIGRINEIKIRLLNRSSYKQYATDEVLDYINSFPGPKSYAERSYFQYKCNTKLYGVKPAAAFCRNIACFFAFWMLFLKRGKAGSSENIKYVFISDEHKMDIIPEKYKGSFVQVSRAQGWLLGKTERKLLLQLWRRYPFSYYFLLKNLIKIADYNWAVETYHPDAVLCSCEYSFTSSFLTYYCHQRNVKHINLMHGYNMIDLKCPFSTFDVMSIWDSFFVKAYEMMRCGTKNFQVDKPNCMKLNKYQVNNDVPVLKYYSQNYVKMALPVLEQLQTIAERRGMSLVVRPHPSYPFDPGDKRKLSGVVFEDHATVNIEQSINGADYVAARNSTVLYQAAQLDKTILIDDVSLPEEYKESRKKGAFLWETQKTSLLSDFIRKEQEPDRSVKDDV